MVSDTMIEQYVANEELSFTDEISNAIYLLRNGKMIDGTDEFGERTEDHKTVQTLIVEGKDMYTTSNGFTNFWNALYSKTGMVHLVSESQTALITKDKKLTTSQQHILDLSSFEIERY